jgi:hypothetical protein
MRADGYLSGSESDAIKPATVVDFPDPVDPTTALCLEINLSISIRAGMDSVLANAPILTWF